MRKTKIICTIGPATESKDMIKQLIKAGMNVARINFSHGLKEDHKWKNEAIKEAREELGTFTAILLDTKGPEIRTGKFAEPEVLLTEGQKFTLTSDERIGDSEGCQISYAGLASDVKVGDKIRIDDGLIGLVVDEIKGNDIICTVENSGIVKNNKGINVPNVNIKLPSLTEKDKEDIVFGIENGIDYIAASFVRKKDDVLAIRRLLAENGGDEIRIISKIENKEGLNNIDEIIEVSDGIMVARGDLGVEIPEEEVPLAQKMIIKKCNSLGKIVVTATQMLDSMMRNPRPTRAEVTDVANAIFDGTDAIMLSGETAAGKYPIESIRKMVDIALSTEAAMDCSYIRARIVDAKVDVVADAIGNCTVLAAGQVDAGAILTPTTSGKTAFLVAKFRPETPIIALTYQENVARRLSLCWGTSAIMIDEEEHSKEIYASSIAAVKEKGLVKDGDIVVITAGVPLFVRGNTNLMRIHRVGDQLS
ncbi:MAG: pyruvate kinase [Firmicutes bacterium]|nr:pyruvate kinase [Bacillota bacterium]